MWEDVVGVVSLEFSFFSALSHLICLHSQRHVRFPLALSLQPASDVYGQKLWFVMSGCFSVELWGLTCRHSCSEAVFCLLGEFPETARHKEGSFGIRSSSIRTTWPSKRICQCFNSYKTLLRGRLRHRMWNMLRLGPRLARRVQDSLPCKRALSTQAL